MIRTGSKSRVGSKRAFAGNRTTSRCCPAAGPCTRHQSNDRRLVTIPCHHQHGAPSVHHYSVDPIRRVSMVSNHPNERRHFSQWGGDGLSSSSSSEKSSTRSRRPSKATTKGLSLEASRAAMEGVCQRLLKLQNSSDTKDTTNQLKFLLEETQDCLQGLVSSVERKQLNPSGKHGKELSQLLEQILQSYRLISSQISLLEEDISIFGYCQEALEILSTWNLNVGSAHYDCAIAIASREGLWKEASHLFWKQIDPEGGYNPVHVSLSNPQGLYAIARLAQQEESAVAELVFDAVMQLSMVSPQDQATYVLAAGTALGQAGEWESAVEYLKSSYSANRLGPPLLTSVMQACLLSGQTVEAWQVYADQQGDTSTQKGIAKEWQWGGERDTVDPLTRDMALQAIWASTGMSATALDLFQQILKEGVTISHEALLGIVEACEQDGDVEGALSILDYILENADRADLIVPGLELSVVDCGSDTATQLSGGTVAVRWLPESADLLASVLRTCNAASRFGLGILYLRKVELAMPAFSSPVSSGANGHLDSMEKLSHSIFPVFQQVSNGDQLLASTMVSLCGLRCYADASRLYDLATVSLYTESELPDSGVVQEYAATEEARLGTVLIGNPWTSASRHIQRMTSTLHLVKKTGRRLSKQEANHILAGLAGVMQSCTNSHHPDVSLRLLADVEEVLPQNDTKRHDAITAETIHAHRWNKDPKAAIELFQSVIDENIVDLSKWRLTCSAGLSTMVDTGRGQEAVAIFNAMDDNALSADCYSAVGKYLFDDGKTKDVGDLYRAALDRGYLSEELSLLAMKTVVKSRIDNRIRVLRNIVDDNANRMGIDRIRWMRSSYWHVKRAVGFKYARLLMWWNDPETCHFDELELAISEFHERKRVGLRAKHDVARVIVANAKSVDLSNGPIDPERWQRLPSSQEAWVELLVQLVRECQTSSISNDATFVDDVVAAYRNLDANRECADFMAGILSRDVRVKRDTLLSALEAAKAEQSIDLTSDIRMLVSQAT